MSLGRNRFDTDQHLNSQGARNSLLDRAAPEEAGTPARPARSSENSRNGLLCARKIMRAI